jgi:hypothetical protein
MSKLMNIADRATCLVRGHRWSNWQQGGYLAPYIEGHENRACYRCPKNEYRPDEAHWSHVQHPADEHDAEIGGPA